MTQRHWYQARKKGAGDPEDGTISKTQSSADPLALSVYLVSYKVI